MRTVVLCSPTSSKGVVAIVETAMARGAGP